MKASIFLSVRILDEIELCVWCNVFYLGQIDELWYLLAIDFEVKTGILKCGRQVGDRLANILCLILRRYLCGVSKGMAHVARCVGAY